MDKAEAKLLAGFCTKLLKDEHCDMSNHAEMCKHVLDSMKQISG